MMTIEPGNELEKYLCDQAYENGVPISGTFELLPTCNLNCKMCYIRMTPEEMRKHGNLLPVEEWLRIAEEGRERGLLFVLLTGGEPLMYPHFKELYRGLRKLGMIVTVNTNGTLIDDEIVELFSADLPRRVNVSLYGSSDRIYGELCGDPNGYSKTITGIKRLQKAGIPVKINYTLSGLNSSDLENMASLSEELELPISMPTYMFPPMRKKNLDVPADSFTRMNAKEAAKVQMAVLERAYGQDPFYVDRLEEILEEMQEKPDKEYQDPPGSLLCSAGVSAFWVNWRGRMTACGMVENPHRDIRALSFDTAWKEIQEETQQIYTSGKCFNCRYRKHCHTCPASALAETGNIEDPGTYNCDMCHEYERLLKERVSEFRTP